MSPCQSVIIQFPSFDDRNLMSASSEEDDIAGLGQYIYRIKIYFTAASSADRYDKRYGRAS